MSLRADYSWYQEQAPYADSLWVATWRLCGIYLDSLDARAWVTPIDGLRWKWRIKFLSWYEEGIEKGEYKAMQKVEEWLAR